MRLLEVLGLLLLAATAPACGSRDAAALPAQLTDQEFWALVTALSEPPGTFRHSDNLVSNEPLYAQLSRMLRPAGGVYIGVGPEQNFSYIARLRPGMAFIVDIRHENRNLHLLYKALFETSADRAEFLSRLFSRERSPDAGARASVHTLFDMFDSVTPSRALYEATTALVRRQLVDVHRLPLQSEELRSIDDLLAAFHADGPAIHYGRSLPASAAGPSYRELMTASDLRGVSRSFLASDDAFAFVKDLHARNLIVPVVGDFAGPHAIKRVGDYIWQRGSTVSAFYSSNVEVYLNRQQQFTFCQSLAHLPYTSDTWFIRSKTVQPFTAKLRSCRSGR